MGLLSLGEMILRPWILKLEPLIGHVCAYLQDCITLCTSIERILV